MLVRQGPYAADSRVDGPINKERVAPAEKELRSPSMSESARRLSRLIATRSMRPYRRHIPRQMLGRVFFFWCAAWGVV